ncbi:G-protein coupled receptor 87-like [Arapaima gigas]
MCEENRRDSCKQDDSERPEAVTPTCLELRVLLEHSASARPNMYSNATAVTQNQTSDDPGVRMLWTILYFLIFVLGLLLNCMALWIFCQINGRSSFALYLKNIAAADLLMTLTFPLHIMNEARFGPWWLPALECRYSAVLFYTCMYVSILFLGLLSLDRYLKIVRPFGSSRLYSYGFTQALAAGVWLGMTALSLPNTVLTDKPPTLATARNCTKLKSKLGVEWHTAVAYINIVIFTVVLVVLMASYVSIYRHVHRSNAQFVTSAGSGEPRPGQNITIVLMVFFICFVPYHLWRIPFTLSQVEQGFSAEAKQVLMHGKSALLFLSACNVCLDPIIYFLMCRSFTRKLRRKLCPSHASTFAESGSFSTTTQVRRFREYIPAKE